MSTTPATDQPPGFDTGTPPPHPPWWRRKLVVISASGLALILAASIGAAVARSGSHPAAAPAPAPSASALASKLGCSVAPYAGSDTVADFDTVRDVALTAPGQPDQPCEVGNGSADDVLIFASQAKETDWLHQNRIAMSASPLGEGDVGVVVGNRWIIVGGSGVGGLDQIAAATGGRAVTTF